MSRHGGKTGDAAKWWARQYRMLLEKFPRPDGEPWRGSELARQTGGLVSSAYHASLLTGKIDNPGFRYLQSLSEAIDFPLVLWTLPPEEWDEELERHKIACRLRPRRRYATGETLARKVERLFESWETRTGEERTSADVARASDGRLSEADVDNLRSRSYRQPTDAKIIPLADAFKVDYEYFFEDEGDQPLLDHEAASVLTEVLDGEEYAMVARSRRLSDADRHVVMHVIERLQAATEHDSAAGSGAGRKD